MEIRFKIGQIDYGTIAAKAMPLLGRKAETMEGAVGKLLSAIAHLPTVLIYELFDAIPEVEKNGIVASLVEENQERIVGIANGQLHDKDIGISVESLSVTPDLQIRLAIGSIDYSGLIIKALPLVRDKLAAATGPTAPLLSKLSGATPSQIQGILAFLPQGTKDAAAIYLLNQNHERILSMISGTAQKHGIGFAVSELSVEA